MAETKPRPVYLIIYSSRLFPAHWSLWIPSLSNGNIGRRIHVIGDALNGFQLEFDRKYDIEADDRPYQLLHLADTLIHSAAVTELDTGGISPQDKLEEIALTVPAPAGSLRASTEHVRGLISIFWNFG
jgi:hypothetical protein